MLARAAWTLALGPTWFGSKPAAPIRAGIVLLTKSVSCVRRPALLFSSWPLATAREQQVHSNGVVRRQSNA